MSATPASLLRRHDRPLVVRLAGVFLIAVTLQLIDAWFARGLGTMPVNAAVAVALVTFLIAPTERWPHFTAALVAAGVVVSLAYVVAPATGAFHAVADTAAGLIGAGLYRHFVGGRPHITRLREVLLMLALCILPGPAVVALVGHGVTSASGSSSAWVPWLLWFSGSALACLLIIPAVLSWTDRSERGPLYRRGSVPEAVAFIGLFTVAAVWAFSTPALDVYLIIPFLIWAALRFGAAAAADASLLTAIIGVGFTAVGLGDFTGPGVLPENAAFGVQAFLAVTSSTTLIVAAILAERRDALAEVSGHRERLEAEVEDRTAELEATVARLREASSAKDRFLANMSHELRTPLNSIIGFSNVMQQGLAGDTTAEQRRQLAMIERSGRHLLGIVSDVLDIARAESGGAGVSPAEASALGLVRDVIEVMAPLAAEKGLTLTLGDSAEAAMVTDVTKVRQALINLVGNAVKFTAIGGVSLTVLVDEPFVRFVVTDTGRGFAMESAGPILREFVQLESPDGMKPDGAGLGLAITQRFARLLGGDLIAEGEPGVGARFTLTLLRDVRTTLDDDAPIAVQVAEGR